MDSDAWRYFEKVACITTDLLSKRIESIKVNMTEANLLHTEFVVVPRSSMTANVGVDPNATTFTDILQFRRDMCMGPFALDLLSHHIDVVSSAFMAGYATILVLEDDNFFDVTLTQKYLPGIIEWMKTNDWWIINFGAISFPIPFLYPVAKHVSISLTPKTAHCYALSKNGMRVFLNAYLRKTFPLHHVDQFLADIMPLYHVASPPFAFQTEKPALFRLAMSKGPRLIRDWAQRKNFRQFCETYSRVTLFTQKIIVVLIFVTFLAFLCKFQRKRVTR